MKKGINIYIKAIIFDMDGVITNTMPYHFDAWKAALAKRGLEVNCYDVYKREGQRGEETIREICREHNCKLGKDEQRKVLKREGRDIQRYGKDKVCARRKAIFAKAKEQGLNYCHCYRHFQKRSKKDITA